MSAINGAGGISTATPIKGQKGGIPWTTIFNGAKAVYEEIKGKDKDHGLTPKQIVDLLLKPVKAGKEIELTEEGMKIVGEFWRRCIGKVDADELDFMVKRMGIWPSFLSVFENAYFDRDPKLQTTIWEFLKLIL